MKKSKFYFIEAAIFICLFVVASGCTAQSPRTFELALKLKKGLSETYRLNTLSQRKVSVEGPLPKNVNFQGGQTTDKIEIIFDQYIQTIDDTGYAAEKITIKELKYFEEVKDKTVLDFDSSRDDDPNNALAALIGQSYSIEITPSGKVSRVIDVNNALAAIKDNAANKEAAKALLLDKSIERRHSIPLPDSNDNKLAAGGTWSNITSFDFGLMGFRAYERKYTLKGIEKRDGSLNAIIDMSAIPSAEGVKESYEERGASAIPPMTDVRQTYTGQMNFDLTNGTLIKYQENLKNEWLIVPPGSGQSGPPAALNMTASQSYDIEKID